MKPLPLLLLLMAGVCAANLPVIRVASSSETTEQSSPPSWMRANSNLTETTSSSSLAATSNDCECSCPACTTTSCDCTCNCPSPEQRLQRERHLQLQRDLLQPQMSLGDCPGAVTSMHLWDAKKDVYLREIREGDILCKPRFKVNLEARVESCPMEPVESVQFQGSLGTAIENEVRYFAYGDFQGDIFGRRMRPGQYSVTAIPYSQDNAMGLPGKNLTRTFRVLSCASVATVSKNPPPSDAGAPPPGAELALEGGEDRLENTTVSSVGNAAVVSSVTGEDTQGNGMEVASPTSQRQLTQDEDDDFPDVAIASHEFDFVLAGFPGTETLLGQVLASQTGVALTNDCSAIADASLSDQAVLRRLDTVFDHLFLDVRPQKIAFHCPTAILQATSLTRLARHSPNVQLLVGIRHPIHMMMTIMKNDRQDMWVNARVDLFLMQLGHTLLSSSDLQEMADVDALDELTVVPHPFKILIYAHEQIVDTNQERHADFRSSLQSFLGLEHALPVFPDDDDTGVNLAEMCDVKNDELRNEWLEQGSRAAKWLRKQFFANPHVVTINAEHLSAILDSWIVDPCRKRLGTPSG